MSATVNALLDAASVQLIDIATNTYRTNSPVGTITLGATSATYDRLANIAGGGGTALSLPNGQVWAAYIKNLDPTLNFTIQATPVGAGATTPATTACPVLRPGAVWFYWSPSEPGAPDGSGFKSITVISSAGPVNAGIEYLLAG